MPCGAEPDRLWTPRGRSNGPGVRISALSRVPSTLPGHPATPALLGPPLDAPSIVPSSAPDPGAVPSPPAPLLSCVGSP